MAPRRRLVNHSVIPGRSRSERTRNPDLLSRIWIRGPALTRRPGMTREGLGTGVDFLVGEVPGHDRDRNWEIACVLGEMGDQRTRSFLSGACRKHQDADIGVLLDKAHDLLGDRAFADYHVDLYLRGLLG